MASAKRSPRTVPAASFMRTVGSCSSFPMIPAASASTASRWWSSSSPSRPAMRCSSTARIPSARSRSRVMSGATTRVVKMTAGRARPRTVEKHIELHYLSFSGPTTSSKFAGYFSGHTSSAMASAVAVAVIFPRVGWIAVLFAGAVGWSRMYGNHHFPTDVVHGAAWGVMWGCLVGAGVRLGRREEGDSQSEGGG